MSVDYPTRHSLLMRASDPSDAGAWNEFVRYYRQFILICLWHLKVPSLDCDDIAQEVLLELWKSLKKYDQDRARFKTWLTTIIRNRVLDHFRKNKSYTEKIQSHQDEEKIMAHYKSTIDLEEFFKQEWETYLVQKALENFQAVFSGKAIEAFTLCLSNQSVNEIAEQLGIQPQSVINLKNRVLARLIPEVARLRNELEF
jgi:RNA polymerase sigma factor (sigma-70 family)